MCRVLTLALLLSALWPVPPSRALERGPLLSSLRPAVRADLVNYELGPLEDLPGYDLELSLRDDLTGYDLHETVEYTNQTGAPLSEVALRIYANAVGPAPALVNVRSARCQEQACKLARPHASALVLQLSAALAPGARLHIQLDLRGALRVLGPNDTNMLSQGIAGLPSLLGGGKGTSDYGLLSYGDGIATLAHFYAVVAARAHGRWETSVQKPFGDLGAGGLGFVRATVHAPKGVSVVSSGLVSAPAVDGSYVIRAALVRDFAVVASRGLVQRARQVGDVRVRSHFLPAHTDAGERVLDIAARALTIYEAQFGGYPYADLDVVEAALVGGAGGCEFSGLVSVASMLYPPLPAAMQQLGSLASLLELTTAHEVAHQYWYGLVGSDARESPFVDEALTQWSAALYFERRYGLQRAERELDGQVAMNYRMMRMLGQPDGAVDRPVDSFESPLVYAGLVYGKAAFLYPALRKLVGDAVFFDALHSYVLRERFRTAGKSTFFDVLAELSGRAPKVYALVRHWLSERHGDRDLGVSATPDANASQGDDAQRLQRLLTALTAPPGKPSGQPAGSKEAGAVNAEQLNTLLQSLTGTANGASVEQLRGILGASGSGPDAAGLQQLLEAGRQPPGVDSMRSPELDSGANQRGL